MGNKRKWGIKKDRVPMARSLKKDVFG